MLRFVEMTGIYLDDKKSFGFYNTVNDTFLCFNGTYAFDSVKEFIYMYNEDCGDDYGRLKSLIPKKWIDYIEDEDDYTHR
jgi:hypothetical protein